MLSDKPTLIEREYVINWFGSKENYLEFHLNETIQLNNDWEYR